MLEEIQHKQDKQRFAVHLEGHVGYMSYVLHDGVIEYNHTIVPKELGGRGIGSELVKYGLAYARVNHLSVKPTCSFVAAFINKHDVYQDLLA
jgi:predicted GNAT family acetyltransferase